MAALCMTSACSDPPPGRTYFERNILPILEQKCVGNTSGCHSTNAGDPFDFAAGNLDVTSFENVQKRRDLLSPFGVYPHSLFLIKAVGPNKLKFQYGNVPGMTPATPRFLDVEVQHVGGAILETGSDAFFTLQTWLENGATENGLKPPTPAQEGAGTCSESLPAGFTDTFTTMRAAQYDAFKREIQPILTERGCAAGSCHGAPQSDFYITCGSTEEQQAFNFSQAWSFVNDPVDDSQLLRVPLAVAAGGRGHTGGDQFDDTDDGNYVRIKAWAASVGKLPFANGNPVKQFFEDNVQPVLLTRGCAFQACHSPQSGNDFKMRSGSIGFFSSVALQKNYDLVREEFMALEFPDSRRGRVVAKTILEFDQRTDLATNDPVGGIPHRGGPVLETAGSSAAADPASCPPVYNPTSMPPPTAFCTIQEWIRLERAALGAEVTNMSAGQTAQVVYVQRTSPATAGRLEFDTFQGGADLRISDSTYDASAGLGTADAGTSLIGGCGLGGSPDVQAPDVANDGNRIAFAARATAGDPLGVYVVDINGGNCTRITPAVGMSNGIAVHDFDPAWSPDGRYIVFASTRGKNGATRSRKRFLPQSDIWRVQVSGFTAMGAPEQMTWLSNSEVGPQFMREGRMSMTTEKASDGFYQLAGRRINWDLTDYHPLLGQRKDSLYADLADPMSTRPSMGYSSVTDIREGSDGNFMIILSNVADNGAPTTMGGAGALALFNRSIGPFEADRTDLGYLPSVRVLDRAEIYRGPVSLPDGRIMVSRATSPTSGQFDIVMYNPRDNSAEPLFGNNAIRVDAQLVYKHPERHLYGNRRQLVFGGNAYGPDPSTATVHMPDAPMLFTVLTGNLRRGRPVEEFRSARYLAVFREGMCGTNCTANTNGIFQQRELIGRVPLEDDGSTKVMLPAREGLVFELQDSSRNAIVTMGEEHQLGPGETISMGVSESLFNAICGSCHGSVSGSELDVEVTPDALTNASRSASAGSAPLNPSN
ncbi:MAG: TolB family protein [Kofleriaceae bacterium]